MRANIAISKGVLLGALVLAILAVGSYSIVHFRPGSSAQANHDGLFLAQYFALPFIEDIPNTPSASIRVADCAGGASHATIIQSAIAQWNATNRVRFFYDTANPTVTCDANGYPGLSNVVSVKDDSSVPTADFTPHQSFDSFRTNDWGPEDVGMFPLTDGRVRLGNNYQTVPSLAHELGHATGLSDLYVELSSPCVNANPYPSGETVMDCTTDHGGTIPANDSNSLNNLYNRIPQAIPTGTGDWRITNTTYNSVSFAWTDYSFNEKYQYIGKSTGGFPLTVARDSQSATWSGLSSSTTYCFHIAQANAYGGTAANSPDVCTTTLASGVDLQGSAYSTSSLTPNEGASQPFTLTVKNNGGQASPGSYAAIKFNGAFAPNGAGACFIASVAPNGGTASCTTASILMNFGGGPITVTADNYNNVSETNESNNVFSSGTLGVKPLPPTGVFISPPFAGYGYTDHSSIENGFGVILSRRAGGCGSSGWSVFSQPLKPALSGNSQAVTYVFSPVTHGYCYRVSVTALGSYANSAAVLGTDVNYP